jgi:hypothetical protein
MRRPARPLLLPALLLLALACSRTPADPVEALLGELEAAAEARDARRFAERLDPGFRGQGGLDRSSARAELRRTFAAYEHVHLEVYGVEVDRQDGAARVRCVVELSGRARVLPGLEGLLPPSAVYRFTLDVAAPEGGAWLVRAASWEPAEAPGGEE